MTVGQLSTPLESFQPDTKVVVCTGSAFGKSFEEVTHAREANTGFKILEGTIELSIRG